MHIRFIVAGLLGGATLALPACGDLVDQDTVLAEFDQECRAQFAGGSEDNGEVFCGCSTRKMKEQDFGPFDLMDEEKMRAISDECGAEVMRAMQESYNL